MYGQAGFTVKCSETKLSHFASHTFSSSFRWRWPVRGWARWSLPVTVRVSCSAFGAFPTSTTVLSAAVSGYMSVTARRWWVTRPLAVSAALRLRFGRDYNKSVFIFNLTTQLNQIKKYKHIHNFSKTGDIYSLTLRAVTNHPSNRNLPWITENNTHE